MEEVIHYLQLKNQYYEKFFSVTVKFLDQANQGKWDGLEFFVDNRERILNIIRSYDFKIAKAFQKLDGNRCDSEYYGRRVKELLERRTQLAHKIVTIDLELISKIEEMKNDTIKDLKQTVQTQAGLSSFSKAGSSKRPPKPTKDA